MFVTEIKLKIKLLQRYIRGQVHNRNKIENKVVTEVGDRPSS